VVACSPSLAHGRGGGGGRAAGRHLPQATLVGVADVHPAVADGAAEALAEDVGVDGLVAEFDGQEVPEAAPEPPGGGADDERGVEGHAADAPQFEEKVGLIADGR
jgi:hypothetical protein